MNVKGWDVLCSSEALSQGVNVIIRLTVNRPVSPGIKQSSGSRNNLSLCSLEIILRYLRFYSMWVSLSDERVGL
jgi:hypothetical protein